MTIEEQLQEARAALAEINRLANDMQAIRLLPLASLQERLQRIIKLSGGHGDRPQWSSAQV